MHILKIGLLLGWRQIQRASLWTTILIVCVMMLTFLNLVAVSGILVGLITGSERAVQEQFIGDLQITSLPGEDRILHTPEIVSVLDADPLVLARTVQYQAGGTVEANYRERRDTRAERDLVSTRIVGINAADQDATTGLAKLVVEGEYLDPDEEGSILIGSLYVERYTENFPDITDSLSDVQPGDQVRVTINGATKEFTVKGIVDAKVGDITSRAYITDRELRRLSGRLDRNADRISVRTVSTADAIRIQENLAALGHNDNARIQTFEEALPRFIQDIKQTFNVLGTFIGAVGIVVASITIFIIIFINALSRRRQIGILKGIGIDRRAIEIAYVFQAGIYVLIGSFLGAVVIYGFLVGYFANNPIDFPFSDGILVADPIDTLVRFIVLFFVTLAAGFIPAWMIARQNTLNSILGRK